MSRTLNKLSKTVSLALLSASVALPMTAGAQALLEEIIVSARKVDESIQDIPLSIVAFDAKAISDAGITSIDDIAAFTPGLHISNFTGARDDPALRFRGLDTSSRDRNQNLASAFVDGVYMPGSSQWISTSDLERVEVVKGPQSAFFGRATFSGAVDFVSKDPDEELGGTVDITVGEFGNQDLSASIEGTIIEDVLTARVSGRTYTYDGAFTNNHPTGGRLGAQSTDYASVKLVFTPTENLTIKLRSMRSKDSDGPAVNFTTRSTSNNCGPFTTGGNTGDRTYFCGTLTTDILPDGRLGYDTSVVRSTGLIAAAEANPLVIPFPLDSFGVQRDVKMHIATADWDIGSVTITSTNGWYSEDFQNMSDFQGFEPARLLSYSEYRDTSRSHELRVTSDQNARFRWMAGLYYLDLVYQDQQGGFGCAIDGGPFCGSRGGFRGGYTFTITPDEFVTNRAIFGAASFDVTDQLTLSLEMRRAEDELLYGNVTQELMPGDPGPAPTRDLAGEFKSTSPRFIIDYKPDDDSTIYFNYSEGNTPGNFNEDVATLHPVALANFTEDFGVGISVEEGELTNYELGVKQTLLDGDLYVNAAAYFMEWEGQAFTSFTTGIDTNGDEIFVAGEDQTQVDFQGNGSSDIYGFDLAATYAVNQNVRVSLSYNYNNTEVKEFQETNFGRVIGTNNAAGRELPRSPKNSATFNTSLDYPAANGGSWYGNLDVNYQDGTYAWVTNLAKTGNILNVNLRAGWENERYSVGVYGDNLTDQDELSAARRFTDLSTFGFGFRSSLTNPREIGVEFKARLGSSAN